MKHKENNYYTVGVVIDEYAPNCLYTYKVDNSIKIKIDDYVVIKTDMVFTDMGFKVVQVQKVYKPAQIDNDYAYKYIVDKVDLTLYNTLIKRKLH